MARGGGPASSGVFFSSSSAAKLVDEVTDSGGDFSLELWVSQVATTQPGSGIGGPASIFSMQDNAGLSWEVGVGDAGMYKRSSGHHGGHGDVSGQC